jgi:hypothetical protein
MRQKYALFLRMARVGVFFLREAGKDGRDGNVLVRKGRGGKHWKNGGNHENFDEKFGRFDKLS